MSLHANPGTSASITTAANLVGRRFIGVDGNYCGAGAQPLGVSQSAVDSGQSMAVYTSGVVVVETGGAFSAGGHVQSDSTGRAVAMTALINDAANALTKSACGVALEASTGSGQFVRVKLL